MISANFLRMLAAATVASVGRAMFSLVDQCAVADPADFGGIGAAVGVKCSDCAGAADRDIDGVGIDDVDAGTLPRARHCQ